jgi:hypothetical protein
MHLSNEKDKQSYNYPIFPADWDSSSQQEFFGEVSQQPVYD